MHLYLFTQTIMQCQFCVCRWHGHKPPGQSRTRRNSCPTAPVTPTIATDGPSAVFAARTSSPARLGWHLLQLPPALCIDSHPAGLLGQLCECMMCCCVHKRRLYLKQRGCTSKKLQTFCYGSNLGAGSNVSGTQAVATSHGHGSKGVTRDIKTVSPYICT